MDPNIITSCQTKRTVAITAAAGQVLLVSAELLFGLLGAIIATFSVFALLNPNLQIPARAEKGVGAIAGLLAGFVGGISTVYGPPMTMYLIALRLPKEAFVGAVGVIWFYAALPLTAAYAYHGVLTVDLAIWSGAACVPAIVGFQLGERLRRHIDQDRFRKVLLVLVLFLGLNLIRRAFT